jgi:sugar/nucleoside kinase (ribokinase family)
MPQFDVIIAGELNLDLILYGLPAQLEPERELLANGMALTLGSSSAIVAHNLAKMGSRVGFCSKIGRDALGKIALEKLAEAGVDALRVQYANDGTNTGLTVILQHGTWRNIMTYPGTIAQLRYEDLDFEYLASARHFHLSSYYLQSALQPRVPELFRRLKEAGVSISLDTNDDPEGHWGGLEKVLPHVDVLLPNEREAKRAAGTDSLEEALTKLSAVVGIVVVKLGAQGSLAQRGRERFTRPGVKVSVVDPVGAGDSFDAGFLSEYVKGANLETCLAVGNLAGAFSTTAAGGTEAFRDRAAQARFWEEHKYPV